MNTTELYNFTVPMFIKMLGGLKNVLVKAQAAAQAGSLDEQALLQDRLAPDMFPFVKQVQVATDNAKGCAARLAQLEMPRYEDTEKTFDELVARIDKTIAFLTTVKPEMFAKAEEVKVELPYFPGKYMTGFGYALEYAVPNFFFHVTVAYGLVRKNGVLVGKADYINGIPLLDL
jgi:uncharacterized protein